MVVIEVPKIKTYSLNNYKQLPQIQNLPEDIRDDIFIVGQVLPFKTNNYVVEQLIDWNNPTEDPIFILNFPNRQMLVPAHYERIRRAVKESGDPQIIREVAKEIRLELNPHPAGQMEYNVPLWKGQRLQGIQHKYRETVLFFPSQGQTCHAYCTFCFRWPQFTGMADYKFAQKEVSLLTDYLKDQPEVSDVLFTGGDPMVMSASLLRGYLESLLDPELDHIKNIRIGSKVLAYWPYRLTTDHDSQEILDLFKRLIDCGKSIAFMAHFNHHVELSTPAVKEAIAALKSVGVQIRCQSPVLNHINADPKVWAKMWKDQVSLGLIPYYMFIPRDTGAQHYFAVTLEKAWNIFREAYKSVSGICRTVRGPSMSCGPGKVQVLGVDEVMNQKVFLLRMIQGRDPDWVARPFFAKYDPRALWLSDLEPVFKDHFFFEDQNADDEAVDKSLSDAS